MNQSITPPRCPRCGSPLLLDDGEPSCFMCGYAGPTRAPTLKEKTARRGIGVRTAWADHEPAPPRRPASTGELISAAVDVAAPASAPAPAVQADFFQPGMVRPSELLKKPRGRRRRERPRICIECPDELIIAQADLFGICVKRQSTPCTGTPQTNPFPSRQLPL